MTLTFQSIPTEHVDLVWEDLAPLLIPALSTASGKFDIEDVRKSVLNEELMLWAVSDGVEPIAALTTRIVCYPQRRALAMDWLGGTRMKEWLPMVQAELTNHAKVNNCEHLEAYGRRGWQRWLERFGWNPEYISYRMDLDHG